MKQYSSHEVGARGEKIAADYLKKRGYSIIGTNVRFRGGEIDLIARLNGELIFIEVKTRSQSMYGYPEEYVDSKKSAFIRRAIHEYIRKKHIPDATYIRFDVIAILFDKKQTKHQIHHIMNVDLF